jgi:hypothetical protein
MCTIMTHGTCAWPSVDVAPRRPESRYLARLNRADCCGVTNRPVPSDVDRVTPCWATQLTKELRQPP